MKENLSKNIGVFLKYVSLFIVVKYSITTLYDIYQMAVNNDIHEINDFLNEYVRVLQNFIFFGSILTIFCSPFKAFSLIIPISFWETNHSFFSMSIAPLIMGKHSSMSPEYIRILIFLLIIGIFLLRCIWKKRKITDIFLLLSMTGVLTTAVLFHIITLKQLDYFTQHQETKWKQVMQYKNIEYFCISEHLFCQEITNIEEIKKEYIRNDYTEFKSNIDKSSTYFNYLIASDNSTQSRVLARKPLAFLKYENKTYYILDDESYTDYLKFNERMFGFLAMSSHIVWIFGVFYLIYFHNKRKQKKLTVL